ncbi:5-formyltetrahydrofolate cyclo-ligase [Pseudaestuariivita rosea]|uniref:5-formyltetrahydrofolate cyclo-ligase n=1 Tax=Pseudaestuariivita rosea TaxID=2763263 RepID=UPI001ABB60A3|nr:5-formyltetrahydrofolate cyclo-ligase [Pseudaestuariivita rosea]
MTLADRKAELRKQAFQRRAQAHATDSGAAAGVLSSVLAGYRGVPTAGYIPIRSEIDPLPAMAEAAAHGPVCVPVIEAQGKPLKFRRWEPDAELVEGPFKVMVPASGDWIEPELLIVPLVAFTRAGGRLGYGGGFYDRTLQNLRAKHPTLAIGFAYAAQEFPDIPLDPTDQPLDMVVTELDLVMVGPDQSTS